MRIIKETDFKKFFPNGTLGFESYRKIGNYLLTYSPEYDNGDPHCECDDNVILTMEDENKPIPFKLIQCIFETFTSWNISFLSVGGKVKNSAVKPIHINDVLENKEKVYRIYIDLYDLSYLEFIVNTLNSNPHIE